MLLARVFARRAGRQRWWWYVCVGWGWGGKTDPWVCRDRDGDETEKNETTQTTDKRYTRETRPTGDRVLSWHGCLRGVNGGGV